MGDTTATAGMLLTGSSIGRSCGSNNFAIMDCLEEEHISKEKKMTIHQRAAANFGIYEKH